MTPRQFQAKLFELNEWRIEEQLREYLKVGSIADLESDSALLKKYEELTSESEDETPAISAAESKQFEEIMASEMNKLKDAKTDEERQEILHEIFKEGTAI
jgi:predicted transcriptional regulator